VPQSKEERRLKKNALTRAWKLRNRDKVRGYNSKYQKNHMGLRVSLNRESYFTERYDLVVLYEEYVVVGFLDKGTTKIILNP